MFKKYFFVAIQYYNKGKPMLFRVKKKLSMFVYFWNAFGSRGASCLQNLPFTLRNWLRPEPRVIYCSSSAQKLDHGTSCITTIIACCVSFTFGTLLSKRYLIEKRINLSYGTKNIPMIFFIPTKPPYGMYSMDIGWIEKFKHCVVIRSVGKTGASIRYV